MRTLLIRSAGIAALAALLAPTALAGPCGQPGEPACPGGTSRVVVDQRQTADSIADTNVQVTEAVGAAIGSATALGNTSSASSLRDYLDYDAYQTSTGDATARTVVSSDELLGGAVAATSAYGNVSSGGTTEGTIAYRLEQTMDGDVDARSYTYLDGADTVTVATAAGANISAVDASEGTIRDFVIQDSTGSVNAYSAVEAQAVYESGTVVSTALGNATQGTGENSTVFMGAVQTTAAGESITAWAGYRSPVANAETVSVATAAGNTATNTNTWGYATLGRKGSEVYQENGADAAAASYVDVDSWSGSATSSAYGVGNTAGVANTGSDTGLYAMQINMGEITSTAQLAGQSYSGGTGNVSSVAIGNAASASLCTYCAPANLQGGVTQTNNGNTTAYATVNTPYAGAVTGSAVAVGNTSTYSASGGNW